MSQDTTGTNRRDRQSARACSGRISRFSEVRGSESLHSSTFTAVERNFDMFLGGCSVDITEQHIFDHVTSNDICVINYVFIEANVSWFKPFKFTINPDFRNKLLSLSLWLLNSFVR